ncbi:unnamed protein product, partial [Prorocentrum cordatum]
MGNLHANSAPAGRSQEIRPARRGAREARPSQKPARHLRTRTGENEGRAAASVPLSPRTNSAYSRSSTWPDTKRSTSRMPSSGRAESAPAGRPRATARSSVSSTRRGGDGQRRQRPQAAARLLGAAAAVPAQHADPVARATRVPARRDPGRKGPIFEPPIHGARLSTGSVVQRIDDRSKECRPRCPHLAAPGPLATTSSRPPRAVAKARQQCTRKWCSSTSLRGPPTRGRQRGRGVSEGSEGHPDPLLRSF